MFCKWCGLESETTDVCSWCRKPFSTASAPTPGLAEPAPASPPARPATEVDNYDDLPPPPAAQLPSMPASPAAASPVAGGGMPLGDSFDDIDDDLSPFPFGGGGYQAAPLPPRSAAPPGPPPPSFAPVAPRSAAPAESKPAPEETKPAPQAHPVWQDVPPAPIAGSMTPPVSPISAPQAGPTSAGPISPAPVAPPAAPTAPAGDGRPSLEAIPIRLKTPGGSAPPPPVVPLKPQAGGRTPAPFAPPGGGTPPAPATSVPHPTFRTSAAPSATPLANAAPPGPPAAKPLVPDAPAPAEPLAARAPAPLGGPLEDDGPIDLGLKPLVPAEEDDIAPIATPGGRRLDLGGAPASPQPRPVSAPGAPPPPTRSNMPSLSQAIGRTWYCKWCGMDSDDPNTCSWCRRDLRSAPAAGGKPAHVTVTHGPARGKPVRQPVAKEKEKPREKGRREALPDLLKGAPAPTNQNGAGLPKAAPQIGTFQAAKSKYYGDQIIDPVSGAHYSADSGQTTDTPVEVKETVETNDWTQLGIYSGVFVVLLLVVYGIGTSVIKDSVAGYFAVLAVSSFLAGMLLPILRVAPWPKDDSEDVGWAMGIIPLFGPFAGTMGYGVLGVIRQDVNPAILGVFITSLLLRAVLDFATGHSLDKMVPFREMSGLVLGAQVMPFVTLAGWYSSEMFHKPDE